jgi:hypothetical protein
MWKKKQESRTFIVKLFLKLTKEFQLISGNIKTSSFIHNNEM